MEPNRLSGPDVHFEPRMSVRRRIFSMLRAGPRYCKNDAQDARFKHFGGLAPGIARMVLRMLFGKHFGGRGPNLARMTIPTARPPETVERRRRDRRAGRARANAHWHDPADTRIFHAWLRQIKVDGKNPQGP